MKKSRFTDEQIAFALRQAESGVSPAEICGKMGITGPPPSESRWSTRRIGGSGGGFG